MRQRRGGRAKTSAERFRKQGATTKGRKTCLVLNGHGTLGIEIGEILGLLVSYKHSSRRIHRVQIANQLFAPFNRSPQMGLGIARKQGQQPSQQKSTDPLS
jgi:hypothetical protein